MTTPPDRLVAAVADRYTIERELGAGGMATVYFAEDLKHKRKVAVKVLRPDLAAALGPERFLGEIEVAAKLHHPHILPLYDSGEVDGFLYYVMPYEEGQSLREKLEKEGELPVAEAVRLLRDVVDALAHAHKHGVVHRDIKPDNIMLSGHHALVTDFGVAKAVTEATGRQQLTTAGVALGTPAYMAPEQAVADPNTDHRADIYAVGVLAYELLTGAPPFTGTTPQMVLSAHVTEAPEPVTKYRETVPPALSHVVMRCLEKKPADRWQSAEELLPQIEALATPSGGTTPIQPTGPRRRPPTWIVAAIATAIIVVSAAVIMNRGDSAGTAPSVAPAEIQSIAVLPFENIGGTPDDEYFADGMTDELIAGLGKVEQLRVAARSSAFQFKGQNVDAREVGRQLNVATILEGSIRRSGNLLRLSASLVNVIDGLQMWSDTYEREDGDAFALQDDLTAAIVSELRLRFGGISLAAARAGRTDDPVAHDLYLQGRFQSNLGTETGLRRSLDLYQQALARDSDFALAYAGIAFAHGALADAYVAPIEAYPLARDAALAALERDSLVADAHALLGFSEALLSFDVERGKTGLRRAIELDPNSQIAHFLLGNLLCFPGLEIDEALVHIERSLELDPLSAFNHWGKQACLYSGRRWDDLIAAHEETSASDFFYMDSWVAAAYREKGLYDDALREYRRVEAIVGGEPLYGLALTYVRMGRAAEARAVLRRLEEKAQRTYVVPIMIASVYADLGEIDTAVALTEAMAESRDASLFIFSNLADLDALRADPRVQQILRDAGIPVRR